jgi:hypothetical protein
MIIAILSIKENMNKDAILNLLSDREVDLLVHREVMKAEENTAIDIADGFPIGLPHYTSEISDAWRIHKKMIHQLFSVRKRYFDAIQILVSMEYTESGESLIAWPDVLTFVNPSHLCRAALFAINR